MTFATGGSDGVVCLWDGQARKRIKAYPKYPTSISALDFNCNGEYLAIASSYCYEEGEKE
jgi:cell cycle arrest protein BUB3